MPLLVHAVLGPFGVHGEPVQHARLADREIGDIDHLLDLAVPFGLDLAVFHRDQAAERILILAQFIAHEPHRLTALRRRHLAPRGGSGNRRGHHMLVVRERRTAYLRQPLAVAGLTESMIAPPVCLLQPWPPDQVPGLMSLSPSACKGSIVCILKPQNRAF